MYALDFGNVKLVHHSSSLPTTGALIGFLRFMLCLNAIASSALASKEEKNHLRNPGGPSQPRLLMLSNK